MDRIELIKAEIERLKGKLIYGACASQLTMETNCKEEAYNEILFFIDSLQEEPSIPDIVDEHFDEMFGEQPVSKVWHDSSDMDRLSKAYRDFREQCGIKDPVILNEIEVAFYEGMLKLSTLEKNGKNLKGMR